MPQIPLSPDATAAHAEATRLREAGRMAESLEALRRAAQLAPTHAGVLHDLGRTLCEVGRPAEALEPLRRSIASAPRFAAAHWQLGLALERTGDGEGAIGALTQATELNPQLVDAQLRLAMLLEARGRRREAADRFRRAGIVAERAGMKGFAQARALLVEGRDSEARQVLREAVAADPDDAVAFDMLGVMLSEAGEFDAAAECFESALALAPRMVGAYYELTRCRPVTEADGLLPRMLAAREQAAALPPIARIKLELAIGKAYDDLGDPAKAMAAYDAASAMRAEAWPYDAAAFEAQVERVMQVFTPELLARAAELGDPDPTPVCIFGMPRSGTTLAEQILSAHREVAGAGELQFWLWAAGQVVGDARGPPNLDPLPRVCAAYLARLRELGPGAARVTDKLPLNFLWAGLIHLAFPNATLIHMRREPVATALSMHQTFFSPLFQVPTGGEALVSRVRAYQRITAHWRAVLPPDRFVEVDYEALTADPEPQIRRMVAATGLEWDEACLRPEANDRVVKTPSKWQARQPINRAGVERWSRYEPWLGPLSALIGA